MARSRSNLFRLVESPVFLLSLFVAISQPAPAQQMRDTADGYITAVHVPSGFDVNGRHVIVDHETTYGLAKEKKAETDSPLRDAVQVGAFVYVRGKTQGKTVFAKIVLLRDDWGRRLHGMGVIDKVGSAGTEPVFQADGYRIHITTATKITFQEPLKSLADVGTNTWLHYEGKRDKDGILVAATAHFIPAKPAKVNVVRGIEAFEMGPRPAGAAAQAPQQLAPAQAVYTNPDGALSQDAEVKVALFGKWRKIPADAPLQERVRRVGMSMVPAYQKQLPADHPSKINFRFYAVDAPKLRVDFCSLEGAILISMQMVERLKTDDELAAVLADGVAYNLQRQGARLVSDSRLLLDTAIAEDIASFFIPGVNLVAWAQTDKMGRIIAEMEEQRGRVALALMADAGYDPWQAPAAWRLMAPKKLPADLDSLKYPNRSGYQLGILNVQYHPAGDAAGLAMSQ